MKYKFWHLLCVFSFIVFCSCVGKSRESNKEKRNRSEILQPITRIKIINQTINKGVLAKSDSTITVNHFIKNVGNNNLFLSAPKSSCGCTGVIMSSNIVKPGDTASIQLNINLKEKEGVIGIYTQFNANTEEGHHSLFTKMILKDKDKM